MTTLFRLDASIRTEGSSSRLLADRAEEAAVAAAPGTAVTRRDVGVAPLPSTAWGLSGSAAQLPAEERSPEQREARRLASRLGDELEEADGLLLAMPLYNWGVSQHVKAWVDLVMTDARFGPRSSALAGRPAVLVVARGGDYRPGSMREDWDHASAWTSRVLGDVWGLEVETVDVQLTLAPFRDHMAGLRDEAEQERERALAHAAEAGRRLGGRLDGSAA